MMMFSHRILNSHFKSKPSRFPPFPLQPSPFYLLACHCHSTSFPPAKLRHGEELYSCSVITSGCSLIHKKLLEIWRWWSNKSSASALYASADGNDKETKSANGPTAKLWGVNENLIYLHGIQTCKLWIHRTCTGSASRCSGSQTQPCLRKGWPSPVKESVNRYNDVKSHGTYKTTLVSAAFPSCSWTTHTNTQSRNNYA